MKNLLQKAFPTPVRNSHKMNMSSHGNKLSALSAAIALAVCPVAGWAQTYSSGLLNFHYQGDTLWGENTNVNLEKAVFMGGDVPAFQIHAGGFVPGLGTGAEVIGGILPGSRIGFDSRAGIHSGSVLVDYHPTINLTVPDQPLASGSLYSFGGSSVVNAAELSSVFSGLYYQNNLVVDVGGFIGGSACAVGGVCVGGSKDFHVNPDPIEFFSYNAHGDQHVYNFGIEQSDHFGSAIPLIIGPTIFPGIAAGVLVGSITPAYPSINTITHSVFGKGSLSTDGSADLFSATVNLVPSLSIDAGLISGTYTPFSLETSASMRLEQHLQFDPELQVTMAFDHPVSAFVDSGFDTPTKLTSNSFTLPVATINSYQFQFDSNTTVTPTFSLANTFTNVTDIATNWSLDMTLLKASLDYTVGSKEYNGLQYNMAHSRLGSFDIYNQSRELDFASITGNSFQVFVAGQPPANHIGVWNGMGADNLWSTSGNWKNGATPVNGDAILFDSAVAQKLTTQDLGLSQVNGLTFMQGNRPFSLNGVDLTSTGGILNQSLAVQTIRQNITLGADQVWDGGLPGITINGTVNLAGYDLKLKGIDIANTQTLVVGQNTAEQLDIGKGSTVAMSILTVGQNSAGNGTVYVNDAGTAVTLDALSVGDAGRGNLYVSKGGHVTATAAGFGNTASANALVKIDDNARVDVLNTTNLAYGGRLNLYVSNGGQLSSNNTFVGSLAGANAMVDVRGTGSQWLTKHSLVAAGGGQTALTVTEGGLLMVGSQGSGGTFLLGGDSGAASLTVSNGGLAHVYGEMQIGAKGRVDLIGGAAGTDQTLLDVGFRASLAAGATMALNNAQPRFTNGLTVGGTLSSKGSSSVSGTLTVDGAVDVVNGSLNLMNTVAHSGATVAIHSGAHLVSTGPLTNQAGAVLSNSGTLDNRAGALLSNAGTLTNAALFSNAGTVKVETGGSVNGGGSFTQTDGNTTVNGVMQQSAIDIQHGAFDVVGGQAGANSMDVAVGTTTGNANFAVSNGGLVTVAGAMQIGAQGQVALTGDAAGNPQTLLSVGGLTHLNAGAAMTLTNAQPVFGGGLDVGGTLSSQGDSRLLGALTVDGAVDVASGKLTLQDTTLAHAGAHIGVRAGAELANAGTLDNQSGAVLSNNGVLDNTGAVIVETGGVVNGGGTFIQTAGTTTVNGTLQQASVDIQGGLLKGDGEIASAVTIEQGAYLAPGNSPGTLTINGDLALDGALMIEIGGLAPGAFDVLDVHGLVTFGLNSLVAFDLTTLPSFSPGMYWDFLLSDTAFSGLDQLAYQFQGLNPAWNYHINQVMVGSRYALELASVPEPATLTLMGLGLVGMARASRRRVSV